MNQIRKNCLKDLINFFECSEKKFYSIKNLSQNKKLKKYNVKMLRVVVGILIDERYLVLKIVDGYKRFYALS